MRRKLKYIRLFQESILQQQIEDLKDVCLELTDIGYTVEVVDTHLDGTDIIKVGISFRKTRFNINNIKDTIQRIQDFMSDRGYSVEIYIPSKWNINMMDKVRFINDTPHIQSGPNPLKYLPVDYEVMWCEIFIESILPGHRENKLFESGTISELESDVKDIFLELEDEGFDVDVSLSNPDVAEIHRRNWRHDWTIALSKKSIFKWSDVSDVIERAKEVIESSGVWKANEYCVAYKIEGSAIKGTEYFKNYDEFIDFVSDEGINGIYEIAFIFELIKPD
jgi:hypothetical protein